MNFIQIFIVNDEINEDISYTEKVNEIVPLTDTSSIANGFSFFSSSSIPPSVSKNNLDNDSLVLARKNERMMKLMEGFFLDDLKCLLRWCIAIK